MVDVELVKKIMQADVAEATAGWTPEQSKRKGQQQSNTN
jgi:hypothetical protein